MTGLACAARLTTRFDPLVLIEQHPRHGTETSSRNSEVLHAGIYYPVGSLKARLCVAGNHETYELCARHTVPHRRTGKLIVATGARELEALQGLAERAQANGVELERLDQATARRLEPNVTCVAALLSPTSGIVSAHALMDLFLALATGAGATWRPRCHLTGLERIPDGYALTVETPAGRERFTSELVVNAAGLEADSVAAMVGIELAAAGYRQHYALGSYFAAARHAGLVNRLVYPMPRTDSLGIHTVLDLGGRLRFGPDLEYLPHRERRYDVDPCRRIAFGTAIRRYLPMVRDQDLTPDMAGIRPKLQGPGAPPRDFVIAEESARGLPGFVNLIGIDSPGLTAAPAIAREVERLLAR